MNKGRNTKVKRLIKPKWIEFVNEYMRNGNVATKAYMKVFFPNEEGMRYSAVTNASRLLRKPEVQDLVDKRKERMEKKFDISRQFIIDELMETIAECKSDKDRANLLKSIDILNKMSGQYIHKQEIDVKGSGIIINFITPEESIEEDELDN